ncbi:MAG: hypothetical protein MUP71_08305 [Candidatus Aminicenantes bacterium]|nr:hypothetical protein [Candidatus Aminicenantes bacterium]
MMTGKLARFLLRFLAILAVLAAFAVLDWYPTVKELGRLRRERSDLEFRIRDYSAMAGKFEFPDEQENSLLASDRGELLRALPRVEDDDAWLRLAHSDLQGRTKGIANLMVLGEADAFGPERPGLTAWLKLQENDIRQSFKAVDSWQRYPWHGVFPMNPAAGERLASRPLGIALDAQLPELLDCINRVSWGAARLEIVRLRLELTGRFFRAWLVCRGSYRVLEPSTWLVKEDNGEGDEKLLIDSDSPLLLRKVDPLMVPRVEKKDLPPVGSPW